MTEGRETLALWVEAPGRAALRRTQLPAPGPEEVEIRTRYSAISRGTESLVFHGRVPPSEYQRMRCPFQDGHFPGPVKYGYSLVGRICGGAEDGREVFCLHPHQARAVVPKAAVRALPAGLPPLRAVLGANMETAVNALWDAPVRPGAEVRVVGAGVVGSLVAYLAARVAGSKVQLIDLRPDRAEVAKALGVSFARPQAADGEADLVFHASGSEEGLACALALAGDEGEIVELSWYGTSAVSIPLGGGFHSRRLSLRSSQVGRVAPAQRSRWSHARRLELALELLCDPVLDCLLHAPQPFSAAPEVLAAVCEDGADRFCQPLQYDQDDQDHVQPNRM